MLNRLEIIGHLGADPDLRYTPSGQPVCTFSVATTEKYKNASGERQQRTEWHNLVAWNGLAETCGKYLHKGKQIYASGRLQTRTWTDTDGAKRYKTEMIVAEMEMLGGQRQQETAPEPTELSDQTAKPWGIDEEMPF